MSENDNVFQFPRAVPKPETPRPAPAGEVKVDRLVVQIAEDLLERAKAGEITGAVVMTWCPKINGFLRWVTLPAHEPLSDVEAFKFLGALSLARKDLEFAAGQNYVTAGEAAEQIESGDYPDPEEPR